MPDVELDLLPPRGLLNRETANPLDCADFFEAGEENIYLVDSRGMYLGAACQRQGFRLEWDGHQCQAQFRPMQPAIFNLPINQQNLPKLSAAVDAALEASPGAREVPVLSGGAVVAVARMKKPPQAPQKPLPWKRFGVLPMPLAGKHIFVSSLKNPLLLAFLRFWSGRIPVEHLTAYNMADAFSGREDTLLVYGEDIYPDSANKCEVKKLFSLLQKGHEEAWQKQCYVAATSF